MESNTENQPVHKRRVRYKGTHPRHYNEKYKELNPEKYGETVEKVIRKGGTPAGMHISIMVIFCRFSRGKEDWMLRWDMAGIHPLC